MNTFSKILIEYRIFEYEYAYKDYQIQKILVN